MMAMMATLNSSISSISLTLSSMLTGTMGMRLEQGLECKVSQDSSMSWDEGMESE